MECSNRFPLFGHFEWALGPLFHEGKKNGCFWLKMAQIWEGTSRLGTRPYATTGEFWAAHMDK